MKKFLALSLLAALIAPSTYSSLYCQNASKATSELENAPQTAPATQNTNSPAHNNAANTNLDSKSANPSSSTPSSESDNATKKSAESSPSDLQAPEDAPSTEIPEPQIPFSHKGAKKVVINSSEYWEKTVLATETEENKTTIYTLDGKEVGYITYHISFSTNFVTNTPDNYGYISYLLVHEPFRKKLGVGRYLFNHAKYFFLEKGIATIKWSALPHHTSEEDKNLTPMQRIVRLVTFYESLGGNVVGEFCVSMSLVLPLLSKKSSDRCRYPLFF